MKNPEVEKLLTEDVLWKNDIKDTNKRKKTHVQI